MKGSISSSLRPVSRHGLGVHAAQVPLVEGPGLEGLQVATQPGLGLGPLEVREVVPELHGRYP